MPKTYALKIRPETKAEMARHKKERAKNNSPSPASYKVEESMMKT